LPAEAAITPRARGRRQVRHLVVRAAQLERDDGLLILALEQHAVAEAPRENRRRLERGFDGDVVDLRGQDLLQIVDGHDGNDARSARCGRTLRA
jgi:hypothetical protein